MKNNKIELTWDSSAGYVWQQSTTGDHVQLPLDVSQVSGAVVRKYAKHLCALAHQVDSRIFEWKYLEDEAKEVWMTDARAAIAALAAALGEVK